MYTYQGNEVVCLEEFFLTPISPMLEICIWDTKKKSEQIAKDPV